MSECKDININGQIHNYFHNIIDKQIKQELIHRNIVDENMVALWRLSELSFCLLRDFIKDFNSINFEKDRVNLYVDDNHYITIYYHISDRMCREPLCCRMYYEHGEQLRGEKCILHRGK